MSLRTDLSKIIDNITLDFISKVEDQFSIFIDTKKIMNKKISTSIKSKINKPIFDFIECKRENYTVKNYNENNFLYKNFIINKKTETVVGKLSSSNIEEKLEFDDIEICTSLNLLAI